MKLRISRRLSSFFGNKRLVYWFVSYIMIAVCTVMFNFIAYVRIDRNISMQNDHYVREILLNKKNRIDGQIKIIENFAREVEKNDYVRKMAFFVNSIEGTGYATVLDTVKSLRMYHGIEYGYDNFYIYFQNTDYCIWSDGANRADIFFDVRITEEKFGKKEWVELMNENHSGEFVVSNNGKNVTYLVSVYKNERFKPYATIAVEVNAEDFLLTSENERFNEGFYIIDENKNVLISDDTEKNIASVKTLLEKELPQAGITEYGDKTVVIEESANGRLMYMYYVDKGVFKQAVNKSRITIILFNVLCLIAAIIVAYIFSRRNYKPVKSIMKMFGESADNLGDEFRYIEQKITDVIEENREFSERTEKIDNKSVKAALISRLLSRDLYGIEYREVMETLGCFEVKLDLKCFMVILFYVDISSEMFFEKSADRVEENYTLAKLVIQNVFGELLGNGYNIYFCDVNGFLGCVVNMKEQNGADSAAEKLMWMQKFVVENFNINFSAGISNVHFSADELGSCYSEALSCISQRLYKFNNIIRYSELEKAGTENCFVTNSETELLVRFMKNGNWKQMQKSLDDIFDGKIINSSQPAYYVRCVLYDLIMTLVRTATEMGDSAADEFVKLIEEIEKGANIKQIKERIYDAAEKFCKRNSEENVIRLDIVLEKIKAYVDEVFKDSNLSVAMIAEKFNISVPYLSTNFKRKYKTGLLEYIAIVRINEAKKLLAETNMTVENIAAAVGYASVRSFSRNFVRLAGCTPNAYYSRKNKK